MVIAAHNNIYVERRQSARWALVSRIFYQLENDTTIRESQSVNISTMGMCFTTPELLQENIRIKMNIFLSDEAVIPVRGLVIWSRCENGRYQAAIRFSDISEETQDLIIAHAFDRSVEASSKYWFRGWNRK